VARVATIWLERRADWPEHGRNGAKEGRICEAHILTSMDILLIAYPIFCASSAKARFRRNKRAILCF
jgi:hypothetical protein